jgi:ribosomal protein L37E
MAKTRKHLQVQERHIYNPEIADCPHCGKPLQARRHYQWRKTVQQMDKAVYVASQGKECVNLQCEHRGQVYTSAAAQMVTIPECTYGLDVIAQIGWWRDKEHLNRQQIHARLREHRVQISEREVDHLYARYQVLMACAERLEVEPMQAIAAERGGLIISLDGLEPEGASEQLWVVREVQAEVVLVVAWLPRVNHKTLGALLEPVADLGLPILATVSDKQGCVRKVLEEVLPDVPHQGCQSHYLGNATKPIYERDSALKTELRKRIRQGIRKSMGEVLSDSEEPGFSPSDCDGSGAD